MTRAGQDRKEILERIKKAEVPPTPCPDVFPVECTLRGETRTAEFRRGIEAAGGELIECLESDFQTTLEGLPAVTHARRAWSPKWPLFGVRCVDPEDWLLVDVAVVPALCAVAETGSVWLGDSPEQARAGAYSANELVVVVGEENLLGTLDEALRVILTHDGAASGCFVTGPSKTADIEQHLVLGAQGPKRLTVLLVRSLL